MIEAMKQALEALELARSTHDVMLLSDPPQKAWKYHNVDWKLLGAVNQLRQAIAEVEENYQGSDAAKAAHMMDLYVALGVKWGEDPFAVIAKMRDTFAEAEKQEPVGWTIQQEIDYAKNHRSEYAGFWASKDDDDEDWIALYTSPPQRQPLDMKTIKRIATYCDEHITDEDVVEITRRVESEHGINGEA